MKHRFLTLAACGAFLCASSVYAAGNSVSKNETLDKAIQTANAKAGADLISAAKDVLNKHPQLLARVSVRSALPGRTWTVTCGAVLTGGTSLLLDNPCTEILAVAYTEKAPVEMNIDLSALGRFTAGEEAGRPFGYAGSPYPGNFKVRKDGYATYNIPARNSELLGALRAVKASRLSSQELAKIFLSVPRPQSRVGGSFSPAALAYDAKDVAPFKAFLAQLEKDIATYVKYMAVTAEMTDCSPYAEEPFQAQGYIASQNGLVVLRGKDYPNLHQEIQEAKQARVKNAKYCFYVNMNKLGSYENGKGFYAVNSNIPLANVQLTPADTVAFKMQLVDGKPVAEALKGDAFDKAFKHRTITALWLQHYAPRTERALELAFDKK